MIASWRIAGVEAGRTLAPAEVPHFTHTTRRLAAVLRLVVRLRPPTLETFD